MRYRVPVAVLLLAIGVAVGPTLAAAVVTPGTTVTDQSIAVSPDPVANTSTNGTTSQTDERTTPTLGSKLSAFMQSSSVSADASVDNGMWKAGVRRANASAKQTAINRRTESLERRLKQLADRLAAVENERIDIRDPGAAATVSSLAARIQALERSINETDQTARAIGVNTTHLEALRSQASDMSGNQVASMARNLSVGPPATVPGGPPAVSPGGPADAADTGHNGTERETPPGQNGTTPPATTGTVPPGDNGTSPPGSNGMTPPGVNETSPSEENRTMPPGVNGTTPSEQNGMTPPGVNGTTPSGQNGMTPNNTGTTADPRGGEADPPGHDGGTASAPIDRDDGTDTQLTPEHGSEDARPNHRDSRTANDTDATRGSRSAERTSGAVPATPSGNETTAIDAPDAAVGSHNTTDEDIRETPGTGPDDSPGTDGTDPGSEPDRQPAGSGTTISDTVDTSRSGSDTGGSPSADAEPNVTSHAGNETGHTPETGGTADDAGRSNAETEDNRTPTSDVKASRTPP